jgi:1-deoxy-D-xylulose-5-phosphate synthase
MEDLENNPSKFHGIAPPTSSKSKHESYSKVFGRWLCNMAEKDNKLIGITPAMCEGSGMVEFAESALNVTSMWPLQNSTQ